MNFLDSDLFSLGSPAVEVTPGCPTNGSILTFDLQYAYDWICAFSFRVIDGFRFLHPYYTAYSFLGKSAHPFVSIAYVCVQIHLALTFWVMDQVGSLA